mmetsp:Transcript_18570/g.59962  ORF Transcript_18570/g.59962 Transcript_18570/m.59962 type:complete len:189 (+) Transcript_18570:1193-1759(+)
MPLDRRGAGQDDQRHLRPRGRLPRGSLRELARPLPRRGPRSPPSLRDVPPDSYYLGFYFHMSHVRRKDSVVAEKTRAPTRADPAKMATRDCVTAMARRNVVKRRSMAATRLVGRRVVGGLGRGAFRGTTSRGGRCKWTSHASRSPLVRARTTLPPPMSRQKGSRRRRRFASLTLRTAPTKTIRFFLSE